jgi:hypothetical protein
VRVFAGAFWAPKAGNDRDEYEDAFAPRRLPENRELSEFRVAVADGATETSYSGVWARLLVGSYARGNLAPEQFGISMRRLQGRWHRTVGRKSLPWYAEAKLIDGAAAALVGLHIRDEDADTGGQGWEAIALGDCCLFHVRDTRVIECFPLQSASEFSNRPFLLSTNVSGLAGFQERLKTISGAWLSDDSFYLMSDALAAWFMREDEGGNSPCKILRDLGTAEGLHFGDWIGGLRSDGRIRNDDVTLVRIDLIA